MKKSLLLRLVSAVVGLVCGGVFGMLALYYLMVLVGSDFGLKDVRPGAVVGAVIGFILGLVS